MKKIIKITQNIKKILYCLKNVKINHYFLLTLDLYPIRRCEKKN